MELAPLISVAEPRRARKQKDQRGLISMFSQDSVCADTFILYRKADYTLHAKTKPPEGIQYPIPSQ